MAAMEGAYTHGKAEGHVYRRKHPLEDDHGQHDPWSLPLLLDENIATDPAEGEVDAWVNR